MLPGSKRDAQDGGSESSFLVSSTASNHGRASRSKAADGLIAAEVERSNADSALAQLSVSGPESELPRDSTFSGERITDLSLSNSGFGSDPDDSRDGERSRERSKEVPSKEGVTDVKQVSQAPSGLNRRRLSLQTLMKTVMIPSACSKDAKGRRNSCPGIAHCVDKMRRDSCPGIVQQEIPRAEDVPADIKSRSDWMARLQSAEDVRTRQRDTCRQIVLLFESSVPQATLEAYDRIRLMDRIGAEIDGAMTYLAGQAFSVVSRDLDELVSLRKESVDNEDKIAKMNSTYLKEISMNRDRYRTSNNVVKEAVQHADQGGADIEFYEPLQFLSKEVRTTALNIVDEKLKAIFAVDPTLKQRTNSMELARFEDAVLHDRLASYEKMNANLRHEVRDARERLKSHELAKEKQDWELLEAKQEIKRLNLAMEPPCMFDIAVQAIPPPTCMLDIAVQACISDLAPLPKPCPSKSAETVPVFSADSARTDVCVQTDTVQELTGSKQQQRRDSGRSMMKLLDQDTNIYQDQELRMQLHRSQEATDAAKNAIKIRDARIAALENEVRAARHEYQRCESVEAPGNIRRPSVEAPAVPFNVSARRPPLKLSHSTSFSEECSLEAPVPLSCSFQRPSVRRSKTSGFSEKAFSSNPERTRCPTDAEGPLSLLLDARTHGEQQPAVHQASADSQPSLCKGRSFSSLPENEQKVDNQPICQAHGVNNSGSHSLEASVACLRKERDAMAVERDKAQGEVSRLRQELDAARACVRGASEDARSSEEPVLRGVHQAGANSQPSVRRRPLASSLPDNEQEVGNQPTCQEHGVSNSSSSSLEASVACLGKERDAIKAEHAGLQAQLEQARDEAAVSSSAVRTLRSALEEARGEIAKAEQQRLDIMGSCTKGTVSQDLARQLDNEIQARSAIVEELGHMKNTLSMALSRNAALEVALVAERGNGQAKASEGAASTARPKSQVSGDRERVQLEERQHELRERVYVQREQLHVLVEENQVLHLAVQEMQHEVQSLTHQLKKAAPDNDAMSADLDAFLGKMSKVVKDGGAFHLRLHKDAQLREIATSARRARREDEQAVEADALQAAASHPTSRPGSSARWSRQVSGQGMPSARSEIPRSPRIEVGHGAGTETIVRLPRSTTPKVCGRRTSTEPLPLVHREKKGLPKVPNPPPKNLEQRNNLVLGKNGGMAVFGGQPRS